jgi:predicted TIM-barrel fold metal-dependent hydrolase
MTHRIFDDRFHVVDPRFPLVANQGYLPPAFTVDDYSEVAKPLGVIAGAVVSGSFQAMDQTYLVDALARLGPAYVGVTQLPANAADADMIELNRRGVRAIRFNLHRGGSEAIDALDEMARRVHNLVGWHVEFYSDARELADIVAQLVALPQIVIDHLGMSSEGLPILLKLVEAGARVKATGFGRVSLDVAAALKAIASVNPHALVFGTDLPSTRARRPFAPSDIDLVLDVLGEDTGRLALYDNAVALYRPRAM